jgi:hypothetical protein
MARIRFGTFLAPHHPVGEQPTLQFQRDLRLVEHLDRLGFDEFWCGEDLGYRVKALKYAANKTGPPRQAGHRGDLAIGCNPAQRDATDYGANSFDCFIALGLGSLKQLALR